MAAKPAANVFYTMLVDVRALPAQLTPAAERRPDGVLVYPHPPMGRV